jgi:8-amino-7-oxononanoate synthase
LVNEARPFIFSTAPAEPVAAMALAALAAATDDLREQLRANVTHLRRALQQAGFVAPGVDHIVPVRAGDRAMELSARLLARGVFAPGIRWPTVPRGEELIRLTVTAAHHPSELDRIVDALGSPWSA